VGNFTSGQLRPWRIALDSGHCSVLVGQLLITADAGDAFLQA